MKKIALLLALLMILSVAVLASCGKKTEESKPEESAVESKAEESKEESKAEESKAEESKAEESEEESEPEESSEEEIPSAADPDLDGTNVALGKEYTLSGAVNETYNAKLTDGKAYDEAVTNATDPDDGLCYWCGFNSANVTDGFAIITIDLGEATSINTIRVHHGVLDDWAVMPWKSYKFSVSTDGANFTAVAALPQGETDNGTYWAEAGFEAVEARYVKVELELNPAWSFINEIEVYSAD